MTSAAGGARPSVPNIQHTEVTDPMPGKWTATILWGNGRSHLQEPPNVPGTYTGSMSFQVTGQNYMTSGSGAGTVKIPAHSSANVPINVPLAAAPGDRGLSVQLSADNGATASVPVLARTLIPPSGGTFKATMGTSVGRNQGSPNSLFFVDVPAGQQSMSVSFKTADASPDNPYTYELFNPSGAEVVADATPTTTLQGVGSTTPTARANLSVANPAGGQVVDRGGAEPDHQRQGVQPGHQRERHVQQPGCDVLSAAVVERDDHRTGLVADRCSLQVTNTTGVGRTFTFSSSQSDIAPVSTYIPAGVTELVTLKLTPTAAPGTVVTRPADGHDEHVGDPRAARPADGGGDPVQLHGRAAGRVAAPTQTDATGSAGPPALPGGDSRRFTRLLVGLASMAQPLRHEHNIISGRQAHQPHRLRRDAARRTRRVRTAERPRRCPRGAPPRGRARR